MAASRALHALLPDPNLISPDPSLSDPNVPELSLPSSFHSPPPSPRQPRRSSGMTRPGSSRPAAASGSRGDGLKPDGNKASKRTSASERDETTHRRAESPNTDVEEPNRALVLAPPKLKTRQISSGVPRTGLTLREQEEAVDRLDKENFSLKMKIYFLEERLSELSPEGVEHALKQNIELKTECLSAKKEIKRLSKLVLECEKALEEQSGRISSQDDEIASLKDQLRQRRLPANGASDDGSSALRQRNSELEEALREVQYVNEEQEREIQRLRQVGEVSVGRGRIDRLKDTFEKRIAELEEANAALLEDKQVQVDELDKMEEEKQQLLDEVEDLRLENQRLEQQQEAALADRSESRADADEERERTEHMAYTVDSLRDELAASYIDQDRKDEDIQQMADVIVEKDEELAVKQQEMEKLEAEWRAELEAAEVRADQAREEHERQVAELQETIQEREADLEEFREKAEDEMQLWQEKLAEKDEELQLLNEEIDKANEEISTYGERVRDLEADLLQQAKECEESERQRQLLLREQGETEEMHAAIVDGLKAKYAQECADHANVKGLYEKARQTLVEAHNKLETLEEKVADLEGALAEEQHQKELAELDRAEEVKRRARDQTGWQDERKELEEYWGRISADKDLIAERLRGDLKDTQDRLARTEQDFDTLRSDLNETRKVSESRTTDQFTLRLEYDRVKRDLSRCEDDIERLRRELDKKEEVLRERESDIAAAHARNLEMHTQLATVTQAKLNISDKLDLEQQARKAAENERDSYRSRTQDLEQRSSKAERTVMTSGEQLRAQITERNTLLMTVFTCVDDVLGGHNRKDIQRPFDNFQAFHDKLLKRLNTLTQIRADFDRRCKDTEAKFSDKMGGMDKQLQVRMKQLDKVEAAVRSVNEAKLSWRKKLATAEGELEAVRATNADLARQLDSVKRGASVDNAAELRATLTRASNAEKQALAAQNRLRSAEERFAARLKEFEAREKLAEEKVKRERQGAKELQAKILSDSDRRLKEQINLAEKREGHIRDLREGEPR